MIQHAIDTLFGPLLTLAIVIFALKTMVGGRPRCRCRSGCRHCD